MSNLSIERLKDFERDPLNNFLTRSEMMEAVKELIALREALKGEQVPMFLKQTGIGSNGCQGSYKEYVTIDESEYEENPVKHLKLFTTPQKPVVLPPFKPDEGYGGEAVRNWVRNETIRECKAAIDAAGGIVKDGE